MQDSPETDITCKKNKIDRRPFIYKARLIYKSCKRGYFLISNKCILTDFLTKSVVYKSLVEISKHIF